MLQRLALSALVCAPLMIACDRAAPSEASTVPLTAADVDFAAARFSHFTISSFGARPPHEADSSHAHAVNNRGEIVGYVEGHPMTSFMHATLWRQNGTAVTLSELPGGAEQQAVLHHGDELHAVAAQREPHR